MSGSGSLVKPSPFLCAVGPQKDLEGPQLMFQTTPARTLALLLVLVTGFSLPSGGRAALASKSAGLQAKPYSSAGALLLDAFTGCSAQLPGKAKATFRWTLVPGSTAQWLDLSLFDNGFAPGTFISAGPLSGSEDTFTWEGLLTESVHYWRVNSVVGGAWQPSETAVLTTPRCVPGAAVLLEVHQECSTAMPGTVRVEFAWQPSTWPGAEQQWLDLSLQDNGFIPDTFIGAGPFALTTGSFAWDGIRPGLSHFWHVNTRLGGTTWVASETDRFASLVCPATTVAPTPTATSTATATATVTPHGSIPIPSDLWALVQTLPRLQGFMKLYQEADIHEIIWATQENCREAGIPDVKYNPPGSVPPYFKVFCFQGAEFKAAGAFEDHTIVLAPSEDPNNEGLPSNMLNTFVHEACHGWQFDAHDPALKSWNDLPWYVDFIEYQKQYAASQEYADLVKKFPAMADTSWIGNTSRILEGAAVACAEFYGAGDGVPPIYMGWAGKWLPH
jgi:hypothetical protein